MHVINTYYIVISITITITDSIFHITITITMDFFFSITIILLLHQYIFVIITITITITYYPMSAKDAWGGSMPLLIRSTWSSLSVHRLSNNVQSYLYVFLAHY